MLKRYSEWWNGERPRLTKTLIFEGVHTLVVYPRFRCFARVFPAKLLDLKSLRGQTKAEELGAQVPEFLRLRLSPKALRVEPFLSRFWCKTAVLKNTAQI